MKRGIILVIISLIGITNVIAQNEDQNNTDVGEFTIIVKGFESDEGKAMIALFDSEENYSETGEKFKYVAAEIKDSIAVWIIDDLPFGEYAIKLYHDENGNKKMDRNMLGIPSEDYGFSNNAKGSFSPADYEDAKFLFTTSGERQEIIINE